VPLEICVFNKLSCIQLKKMESARGRGEFEKNTVQ